MNVCYHILVVSDQFSIFEKLEQILVTANPSKVSGIRFEMDFADSGEKALGLISGKTHLNYSLIFVGSSLLGSWSGLETIRELWKRNPWYEIMAMVEKDETVDIFMRDLGITERLFPIKSIDKHLTRQLVHTLCRRWASEMKFRNYTQVLQKEVEEKTSQLQRILIEKEEFDLKNRDKLIEDSPSIPKNNRILIVDDNEDIHQDFRKILKSVSPYRENLKDVEDILFDDDNDLAEPSGIFFNYELESAYQGKDALEMVVEAEQQGRPFAMAFMDVRMPPGWDGIQTIERIWESHPYIEMVIVTAHADYTWEAIIERIGRSDRLMFIRKPFDSSTVKQLALTLTQKWALGHIARQNLIELGKGVAKSTDEMVRILEGCDDPDDMD